MLLEALLDSHYTIPEIWSDSCRPYLTDFYNSETSFGQIEAQKFYERLGFQKARFDRPYSVEWPKWVTTLLDISYVACYKRHQ